MQLQCEMAVHIACMQCFVLGCRLRLVPSFILVLSITSGISCHCFHHHFFCCWGFHIVSAVMDSKACRHRHYCCLNHCSTVIPKHSKRERKRENGVSRICRDNSFEELTVAHSLFKAVEGLHCDSMCGCVAEKEERHVLSILLPNGQLPPFKTVGEHTESIMKQLAQPKLLLHHAYPQHERRIPTIDENIACLCCFCVLCAVRECSFSLILPQMFAFLPIYHKDKMLHS